MIHYLVAGCPGSRNQQSVHVIVSAHRPPATGAFADGPRIFVAGPESQTFPAAQASSRRAFVGASAFHHALGLHKIARVPGGGNDLGPATIARGSSER